MNQEAYAALTKMINAFPQSAANLKALLLTYDEDLAGVSNLAIIETAGHYRRNEITDQNITFAPSIAEFVTAARKQDRYIQLRGRQRLEPPRRERYHEPPPVDRVRMGFKMSLLSMGIARREVDAVAEANRNGLDELMALAQRWGVPIPEELFAKRAA